MAGIQTLSEYVTRTVPRVDEHWHVDTTWSDESDYVCETRDEAVEKLSVFASRVASEQSVTRWKEDTAVIIKHADTLPDYASIRACTDSSCEISLGTFEDTLADDDPLEDLLGLEDVVHSYTLRGVRL